MDNQQGHTLWRMELYSMLCGSLDGRGIYERMDTCACMAESLCCPPEMAASLLICYAAAKSLQSCPTLCDPIDSSLPGSPIPGILQARTLEWVAISFSNACMHAKSLQSCPTLRPHGQQPTRLLCPQDSLGKNTGVGCHFLLPNTNEKV